jgi:tRNA threonylcarbamoyladenosine biosynthesis protein TsaE
MLSEAALESWGRSIGAGVARPAFIVLSGELGAGKSVLARAIARGAGVTSTMPSPTYNLLFRYRTDHGDVVHLDLYRLERPEEVGELGWWELPADDEIVVVEWPERAAGMLPPDHWEVRIDIAGPTLREVSAFAHGSAPDLPLPEA